MSHYDEEFDDEFDEEDGHYVIIEREREAGGGGIGSFLLGAAIGAGIALLFAPRSGAETRADIKRRAGDAKDAASRVAQGVTDTVTDTFQDARRKVEEQIDSARDAVQAKTDQVRRAMDAGRAAADEARVDLETRLAETKAAYRAGADVARESRVRRQAPATSALAEE
jgi:gas vesicle protein